MAVEGARVAGAGTADAGLAGMGQRVFELLLAANKPDVVTVTYMVSQGVRADDVPLSLPRPVRLVLAIAARVYRIVHAHPPLT